MRVLLCAYHEAGYRALRTAVARGHEVAVATHASPPEVPSVTALASNLGLPLIADEPVFLERHSRSFRPDIIFSVYYRDILPHDVLDIAPRGAFNFHPSLLPRHRGCFSAPWAIIEGDDVTGVTCHRMVERVDAGGIVTTAELPISDTDTGFSLYYKLVDAAVELFTRVLDQAARGLLPQVPQKGAGCFHSRAVPNDGVIDPTWPRDRIERFIRALHFPPFPPACVVLEGMRRSVRSLAEYDAIMGQPAAYEGQAV